MQIGLKNTTSSKSISTHTASTFRYYNGHLYRAMEIEKGTETGVQHVEGPDNNGPSQEELHVHATTWLASVVRLSWLTSMR